MTGIIVEGIGTEMPENSNEQSEQHLCAYIDHIFKCSFSHNLLLPILFNTTLLSSAVMLNCVIAYYCSCPLQCNTSSLHFSLSLSLYECKADEEDDDDGEVGQVGAAAAASRTAEEVEEGGGTRKTDGRRDTKEREPGGGQSGTEPEERKKALKVGMTDDDDDFEDSFSAAAAVETTKECCD